MKPILLIGLSVAAISLTACNQANTRSDLANCSTSVTHDVAAAVAEAKRSLGYMTCQSQFDHHVDHLLDVGENNPAITNKKHMSDFLVWSNQQGIITQRQAQDVYNRHFSTTFISLPDDYNVCSYRGKTNQMVSDMQNELKTKERGLLRIAQDKAAYATAVDNYHTLSLVFDATNMACEADLAMR